MLPVQSVRRCFLSRRWAVAPLLAISLVGMSEVRGDAAHAATLPARAEFEDLAPEFSLYTDFTGNVWTSPTYYPVNSNYRRWFVAPSGFGTVTIRHRVTGWCLDSNTARHVYTLPCNGGSFQKWLVGDRDFGTVILRNLATSFVLDSNLSGNVYTGPENGGSFQKWIVRETG